MTQPIAAPASATPDADTGEEKRLGLWLTLPAQLLVLFIALFPICMQIYISLTDWSPLDGIPWYRAYELWIGLLNYVDLAGDPRFWSALWRTCIVMAICVPVQFFLGLGLAILFVDDFPGKRVLYSTLLVPMMVVPAVAGYMFFMLFQSGGPVNDLLDLQRIESGDLNLRCDAVDLGATLDEAIAGLQGEIDQKSILMGLRRPESPIILRGDAKRVKQVLTNILSNAIKFSTDGGAVSAWFEMGDGFVDVVIRDRGIGIPEGAEEKVFGRFTQVDDSETRSARGSGLGLHISRRIMRELDGDISYTSVLGKGSVFRMRLPIQADAGMSQAKLNAHEPA